MGFLYFRTKRSGLLFQWSRYHEGIKNLLYAAPVPSVIFCFGCSLLLPFLCCAGHGPVNLSMRVCDRHPCGKIKGTVCVVGEMLRLALRLFYLLALETSV